MKTFSEEAGTLTCDMVKSESRPRLLIMRIIYLLDPMCMFYWTDRHEHPQS
jgi:hypothetical protein